MYTNRLTCAGVWVYTRVMKKILTPADENWRPQLGYELKIYMVENMLPKVNRDNLSRPWSETDMARYVMAHGIAHLTGGKIPRSIKRMFKRFDKDLDV